MAYASVSVVSQPVKLEQVEVAIIGGGICGVLAGREATERKLSYVILEREEMYGGNWHSLANSYSQLQVRPSMLLDVLNGFISDP
jgi:cation diffusion facilitator CzcD-associated flavoprotein CzcO